MVSYLGRSYSRPGLPNALTPRSSSDAVGTLKTVQGIINSYLTHGTGEGSGAVPTPADSPVSRPGEDGKWDFEEMNGGVAEEVVREDTDRVKGWAARSSTTMEDLLDDNGSSLVINATLATEVPQLDSQGKPSTTINQENFHVASNPKTNSTNPNIKMGLDVLTPQVPTNNGNTIGNGPRANVAKETSPFSVDSSQDRLYRLAGDLIVNVSRAATDDAAGIKAATAAFELAAAVRPPGDTVMGWFANMSVVSAVRLFLHWGAFDLIPSVKGETITYAALAGKINADEALIARVASMLTAAHVLLHHPAAGTDRGPSLSHTSVSLILCSGQPMSAMFSVMFQHVTATSTILPEYFDAYGRSEPLGPAHVPTTYLAGHPEEGHFALLKKDETAMNTFNLAMRMTSKRVPVTGVYDMTSVLDAAAAGRETVWVDVGGGDGHTVREFLLKYPGLKSEQCVVQDLEEVVTAARQQDEAELRGVRWVGLDFLHDAPIKGALVYYLRHVLRDYSDPVATTILTNVARGLTDPAARVLVSEQLNPDWTSLPGPLPLYAAFKDFSMLSIGGKERSLAQFAAVAGAAGLRVSNVYRDQGTAHAVVEFALKEGGEDESVAE